MNTISVGAEATSGQVLMSLLQNGKACFKI